MSMENQSAVSLVSQIKNSKKTSVEIAKEYLAVIKEKNNDINALITVSEEEALKDAEIADKNVKDGNTDLPLLGLPIAIKDNISTTGIKTTCASKILENYVPVFDAHVIENLKKAGAVIIGKANMDEFAMGSYSESSYFGAVKNPIDTTRHPGGSSGGSAAAVASGMVPFALGSDTGGSVRQPASHCGIVALKPTYGAVSRYGLIAYGSSLDQIGPMAKNVEDTALLYNVIAGHDCRDSTSCKEKMPNYLTEMQGDVKGLKIGLPKEYFGEGLDPEIKKIIMDSVSKLESNGAIVKEISLPTSPYAVASYYITAMAEASSNLERFDGVKYGYRNKEEKNLIDMYFASRSEGFGEEVKRRIMIGTFVLSAGYYDAYYLKAAKVRTLICQDFAKAFSEVDVIASPVTPELPGKIGEKSDNPLAAYLGDIYTVSHNVAGIPSISVPAGTVKDLPVGIQFCGNSFSESTLFKTAYNLEKLL